VVLPRSGRGVVASVGVMQIEMSERFAASSSDVRRGRVFHIGMSVAFIVTALAGFGPTYYLKGASQGPPATALIHFHAFVFSAWLVLLLVQSGLVSVRRVELHRRLGIAGALLAAVMVPTGMMTAIDAARAGSARPGLSPLVFMIFPLGQIVIFAVFLGAALWKRRRPEIHRRLILLANAALITPALARLPFVGSRPIIALGLSALFVGAGMVHDRKTRGRVHPVYLWGGLALVLSGPARIAFAQTTAWQTFARWLVGG
jgi:hypothetical protein